MKTTVDDNVLLSTPAKSMASSDPAESNDESSSKSDETPKPAEGRTRSKRNINTSETDELGKLDMSEPEYSYWRYYRHAKGATSADCRLCGRIIQMGNKSSTGGLMRHMKMVHSELFDQFQQAKEDSGIKRHKRKSNAEDGLLTIKQEDDNKVQASEGQHSMGNNHSPKKRGRKPKVVAEESPVMHVAEEQQPFHEELLQNLRMLQPVPAMHNFMNTQMQNSLNLLALLTASDTDDADGNLEVDNGDEHVEKADNQNGIGTDEHTSSNAIMANMCEQLVIPQSQVKRSSGNPGTSSSTKSVPNSRKNSTASNVARSDTGTKIHSMKTAEIVNRLGSARTKLNEALAEIDALQEELVQRHKAGNNVD